MRRKLAATLVGFALLVAGVTSGWIAHTLTGPNCPTEDSCVADYRDGGWHIEEIVP